MTPLNTTQTNAIRPDTRSDDDNPVLLTAAQASAMFQKTERTWRTWDALSMIPRPMRIGRSLYWRLGELKAWIEAGCPRREEWERIK
jgi:predicted DNA-binding transcriptional regulator AlpA